MRSRSGRIGHIFWLSSTFFEFDRHFNRLGFVGHNVINRHHDALHQLMLATPIAFMLVLQFGITSAHTNYLGCAKETARLTTHFAHLIALPARTAAFKASAIAWAMSFVLASCIRFIRCSAGVAACSFVDCLADFSRLVGIFECII